MTYDTIIIGGGASGFFLANLICDANADKKVLILEKTGKTLQKVKISGGGRCNVTHNDASISSFAKNYPRGENFLKKGFKHFNQENMIQWLKAKGVELKTEGDNRMFPVSNDSQTIVDCLQNVLKNNKCTLKSNISLEDFEYKDDLITVKTKEQSFNTKNLVFAAGSSESLWQLLEKKGVQTVSRVPSLFSFKLAQHPMLELAGVSVPKVSIRIQGSKLQSTGPWLITHQGISGPAVLKLSAFGARVLAESQYKFDVVLNFSDKNSWDETNQDIYTAMQLHKQVGNHSLYGLPKRLWSFIIARAGVEEDKKWSEFSKKEANKLTEELFQGVYEANGKNTFKDEFVTAGGIDLSELNAENCQIKKLPNVYAVGEFLNIDGVTGGFNFQSCWTSAFLASKELIL
jgi:predicted Rossmann fold flavoprotein